MKIGILLSTIIAALFSVKAHAQEPPKTKKILVAYFSRSGNTRLLAEQIQKATGGDIFEIQVAEPYPEAYREVTEQAKREIETGYKPALKTKPEHPEQYDILFIGSPCWWSTIAPPVATFLSEYGFSGKTVVPFMTHEGSRLGHSVEDIRKLCPEATVLEGLPVRGGAVKDAQNGVSEWLRRIGIAK